ncbi:MAG: ribosomal-protein-alanine N-acetyltransferase [Deltaproteobacteria bacterium]|nr:ribosomal-protein-alanine N-acetyltransferase [Deltaproteobacteria bacterium]
MDPTDINEVMAIERTAYRYPWSEKFFLQEIGVQCARSVLAEINGKIVGYVLYWVLPDEVDIHNIAVHREFRCVGIGRRLLDHAVRAARERDSLRVTLEVRKSNSVAQKLYLSQGFVFTGERRGYYSDDGEDALLMSLNLNF